VRGETLVAKTATCPKCKRTRTLKRLPPNFKCADIICDFCGYLAQVKAQRVSDVNTLPDRVLGAAWGPTRDRIDSAIYFPLFLVLVEKQGKAASVWYLAADLQPPEMYVPRNALSARAKRTGWRGFLYDLRYVKDAFVRIS